MFDNFNNKIATQEALTKGSEKMAGPIKTKNKKGAWDPESTDHTTWLQQEKYFDPKALDMYGKKVPSNWIEVEKKAAQKMIDDLGPLDVSPNHPNYKDLKAIRQSAKDRLESIKVTEALGGNIKMHDYLRMNRKNIKMSDYIRKEGTPIIKDEFSGVKKAFIEKKSSPWFKDSKTLTPEEELRIEFPGIDDNLIKNILADNNPQRIAEVKATMKEALKMQEKGMGVEEILNIFKKEPTKHATGGRVPLAGGGWLIDLLKLLLKRKPKLSHLEKYPRVNIKELMKGKKPIKLYSGVGDRKANTLEAYKEAATEFSTTPEKIAKDNFKGQWWTPFKEYASSFGNPSNIKSKMLTTELTPKEIKSAKRYVEKINKKDRMISKKKMEGLDNPPKYNITTDENTVIIPRIKLKKLKKEGKIKTDYMILEKIKKKLGLAEGGIAGMLGE
jgi:hypothetical protein